MSGVDEKRLLSGNITGTLIRFSIPFVIANLLQAFFWAADMFVVGRFCDPSCVSAVGIGGQIMGTLVNVIFGFTAGGTVLIGQYWGASDKDKVRKSIGAMFLMFSAASIVIGSLMALFANQLVSALNTPLEAVAHTKEYVIICATGCFFIAVYNIISSVMRGLGDSESPMKFIAAAGAVNLALDFCFVGGLHMEAAGAAWATVIAQAASVGFALLHIKLKGTISGFTLQDIKGCGQEFFRNILKFGAPIALQNSLIDISFLIITIIINSMGLIASASMGIAERMLGFAMLVPASLSAATAAITAQNMGADNIDRARKSLVSAIGISIVFGIFFFVYCQFRGTDFTGLFTSDPEVAFSAAEYMRSFSIDCILVAFIFNMNAFFGGCGHTVFPMVHSIIAAFLIRIPVSYIMSRVSGATLYEVGFAAPAASLLSVIICIAYYRTGRWKRKVI